MTTMSQKHSESHKTVARVGSVCFASVIAGICIVATLSAVMSASPQNGDAQAPTPSTSHSARDHSGSPMLAPIERLEGVGTHTNDTWNTQLSDPAFWAAQRGSKSKSEAATRSGLTKATVEGIPNGSSRSMANQQRPIVSNKDGDGDGDDGKSGDKTHRTMCVRLCDGYYWPVSFATTDDNFDRDQKACERSCEGPVKLYTYPNPGGNLEEMEDLKGQPYKKMPMAFAFRTTFEPACKCKPHPWEQEAQDRHRVMALEAKKKQLDQQASLELKSLKSKVAEASNSARASAKATLLAMEVETKSKSTAGNKSASRNRKDRSGDIAAADTANRPSLPASDGVVIMRLGARAPISVKTEGRQSKRNKTKQTFAQSQ
jgi:Protein of unknown function (DUF2865)